MEPGFKYWKYGFLLLWLTFLSQAVYPQWKQTNADPGLNYTSIICVSGYIFAVTQSNGIYRSADEGDSWQAVNNGFATLSLSGISTSPDGGTLYVGGVNNVYKSIDYGLNWDKITSNLPNAIYRTVLDFDGRLFAASNSGLFRSVDKGQSWQAVSGLPSPSVHALAAKGGFLFAGLAGAGPGTRHGVYRSSDYGGSWIEKNNGITTDVNDFEILSDRIYIIEVTAVAVSDDNGESWILNNSGLSGGLYITGLATAGDFIFATQILSGIFIQYKTSMTWKPVPTGLPDTFFQCISTNASYCFAGSSNKGIFRRPLSEMTISGIADSGDENSSGFLSQNYPNPVKGKTTIKYRVDQAGPVTIDIIDSSGKAVAVALKEIKFPGNYEVVLDGSGFPEGILFYRLQSSDGTFMMKMVR